MLKKTITYNDLDGNPRTDDFYFNLTVAECTEMELGVKDGLSGMLTEIVRSSNGAEIISMFKMIIGKAYGIKSEDGIRFIKSEKLFEAFTQTDAWNILFMELVTNAEKSAEFMNGIIPAEGLDALQVEPSKLRSVQDVSLPTPKKGRMTKEDIIRGMAEKTGRVVVPRVLKYDEVVGMSQEELDAALDAGATIEE